MLETSFIIKVDLMFFEINSASSESVENRSHVVHFGPGVDNILAMTVHTGGAATKYYYVKDHLGSVQAIVDSDGNIVKSYEYDAFGNVLGVFDSTGGVMKVSSVGNRFLWQGREYSWNTGLYYFRARWYDPLTGRWLSNDPIGISGGVNQYVFCNNNPVNSRDPIGLCQDTWGSWCWYQNMPHGIVTSPGPIFPPIRTDPRPWRPSLILTQGKGSQAFETPPLRGPPSPPHDPIWGPTPEIQAAPIAIIGAGGEGVVTIYAGSLYVLTHPVQVLISVEIGAAAVTPGPSTGWGSFGTALSEILRQINNTVN